MLEPIARGQIASAIHPVAYPEHVHAGLCPMAYRIADAILALVAPLMAENKRLAREVEGVVSELKGETEEGEALRARVGEWEIAHESLRAGTDALLGSLRAQLAEAEFTNTKQSLQLRAADAVMKAIDTAVNGHFLGSRTPIADARLDYGDPRKYEAKEHAEIAALKAQLAEAERVIEAKDEKLREIENHCPCGARPESPKTHPHVGGCPVYEALAITMKGARATTEQRRCWNPWCGAVAEQGAAE